MSKIQMRGKNLLHVLLLCIVPTFNQHDGKKWDPYSSKYIEKVVPHWKRESKFLKVNTAMHNKTLYTTKDDKFRKSVTTLKPITKL